MTNYQHLLPPASVLVPLAGRTKQEAIDELFSRVALLRNLDLVHNLKRAVLDREAEGNTGIGHGVAVAHGKLASLTDIFLCLGVSAPGIEYGAYDSRPVHLLFVAANPPRMQECYLKTLAVLSRVLKDQAVRDRLIGSEAHIVREVLHHALGIAELSLPISA